MATTNWFLPTSISVENNLINAPDTTWSNINYLTTLTGTHTQTASTLCYNANTNYIIATGFNAKIPFGTQFVAAEFEIHVGLNSVSDTNNVKSIITITQYNGSDFGINSPLSDWGYNNINLLYYSESTTGVTQAIAESASFGIKFDAMNDFNTDCYIAYIDSVKLRLHYIQSLPKFYYNGDTTSEVFVTLDKNPAVTNPTTTFSVYHGDPDTTSSGTDAGYHWGAYYSEPNLNDPDGGFTEIISTPGYGDYVTNYLVTDERSTLTESFTLHSLTSVLMEYDVSDLVVGNTYRRAIVLWNIRVPNGKIYDTLYFNINVVDTTPIPDTNPYLLFNGDTSSEVNITLYPNDTTSTTTLQLVHEIPNVNTFPYVQNYTLSQQGLLTYVTGDSTSVDTIGSFSPLSFASNVYGTPDPLYGSNSTSSHIFTYNTTGKAVGLYRFQMLLTVHYYNNYSDYFNSPQEPMSTNVDNLIFNITVTDIPTFKPKNTGTYGNFVI